MKKIFKLTSENKAPERQVESVKHDIKKYIARERRKKTPEDVDFWDFDCRLGSSEEEAIQIHISAINENIDKIFVEKKELFYLEILVKPGHRSSSKKK